MSAPQTQTQSPAENNPLPPSRSGSQAPPPVSQRRRRANRGRSPSVMSDYSTDSGRGRPSRRQQYRRDYDVPPRQQQQQVQQQNNDTIKGLFEQPDREKVQKDTLKLRLDINLDVDVQIKARVHGDVTLSLLN